MIVAITGGSGFIGHGLVLSHLARGDEVRVLSRRPQEEVCGSGRIRWCRGDLLVDADLQEFTSGADVLYHCAGEITDERRMFDLHVKGTRRLVAAAAGNVGRWVQLSSVGAYGRRRSGVVTEETPLDPQGTYEISKVESDLLVQKAAWEGAFECAVLRPSNVYGVGMRNQSLFRLIGMVQRGWFFFIGQAGASANYIHVDNVVEALMLCGANPAANGHTYVLSDQRPLEEFISGIATALQRPVPTLRVPERPVRVLAAMLGSVPGFPLTSSRVDALTGRASYSSAAIRRELGYRHRVSMEEGLREMVMFWQKTRRP